MSVNARTKWVVVVVLAVAIVSTFATAAWAAPTEPTLGLAALGAKIDASPLDALQRHDVEGYLKTVVSGSTITTIPVHVLAVTGYENPDSALILFEAYGPLIDRYGGIVEGISGGPVFVSDNGTDKLIGALSYGDMFTIGGTGLATPIEAMTRLQGKYSPTVESLTSPVNTGAGVIDRVIVAPDPAAYSSDAKHGALVAKPLSTFFVGGVPASSRLFARFQKDMAAHGVSVVAQAAVPSPPVGDASFSTPLVGGASVAALLSRGDLWLGSAGTVTYAASGAVLAYGHPADWDGSTSMYMTNAWVDGIWPSLYAPYKMVRPAAIQGEITQDRGAGIMGVVGQMPLETPITAEVTDADNGESTTTAVYVPSKLLDTTSDYSDIVPMAVYPAASRLLDVYDTGGSAFTTTTVVVSDGTKTYTIVQPNVVDDSAYLLDALTYDPWDDAVALEAALDAGVENLHIVSIDFKACVSQHRNSAEIVSVDVPGGIKTGMNHAQVSLLVYGKAATQTVDVPFAVPPGVNTHGLLTAGYSEDYSDYYDYMPSDFIDSYTDRETVADIVNEIKTTEPNNIVDLEFQPSPMPLSGYDDEEDILSPTPITSPAAIDASVTTMWSVTGGAEAGTPIITIHNLQSVVNYGGAAYISGSITGPDAVDKVAVYGLRSGGTTETLLGHATAMYSSETGPLFYFRAGGLKTNTTLRVHLDASADGQWTAANAMTRVGVRAKVGLTASDKRFSAGKRITLTSVLAPVTTLGGTVTFQQWNASQKRWRSIGSAKIVSRNGHSQAAISWKPGRSTRRIRAHYLGGSSNMSGTSGAFNVHVK